MPGKVAQRRRLEAVVDLADRRSSGCLQSVTAMGSQLSTRASVRAQRRCQDAGHQRGRDLVPAHLVDRLVAQAMRDGLDEHRLHVLGRHVVAARPARRVTRAARSNRLMPRGLAPASIRCAVSRSEQLHAVVGRRRGRAPQLQRVVLQARRRSARCAGSAPPRRSARGGRPARRPATSTSAIGVVEARIEHQRAAVGLARRRVDGHLHHEAVARGGRRSRRSLRARRGCGRRTPAGAESGTRD